MLKFNTLLELAGLNPKRVFLLRHEDKRLPRGTTIYSTWRSESTRKDFEAYQQSQWWKNRFPEGYALASFVVAPGGETLFVGIYDVVRLSRISGSVEDPLLGKLPPEDRAWHELTHSTLLTEYEAKLVIDWGLGTRQWRQLAHKQNKVVLEIRREFREPEFPGYLKFHIRLCQLQNAYITWQTALSAQRGVYLLVFDDGQQYVGSATGDNGFWSRWSNYFASKDGGNVALRGRDAGEAMVCILETARLTDTRQDVLDSEYLWQRKLGTGTLRLGDA